MKKSSRSLPLRLLFVLNLIIMICSWGLWTPVNFTFFVYSWSLHPHTYTSKPIATGIDPNISGRFTSTSIRLPSSRPSSSISTSDSEVRLWSWLRRIRFDRWCLQGCRATTSSFSLSLSRLASSLASVRIARLNRRHSPAFKSVPHLPHIAGMKSDSLLEC